MKSVENIEGGFFFVVTVNAAKCSTENGFMREMANCFDFPNYFGNNLDAVDECMTDLYWIPQRNFKILIRNAKLLNKKTGRASLLISMLERSKLYWDEKRKTENSPDENNFYIEYI